VDADLGVAVSPVDAQPGDFIQYWMKTKDGEWFGHAGVLDIVTKKDGFVVASVFGAHKSLGRIGESSFELKLTTDADRKIYLVRYKTSAK
jgi:hypothetical protein